jgi:hypothetical protein
MSLSFSMLSGNKIFRRTRLARHFKKRIRGLSCFRSKMQRYPHFIQLLPLYPLLPVGFAPRNASLRYATPAASLHSAPPQEGIYRKDFTPPIVSFGQGVHDGWLYDLFAGRAPISFYFMLRDLGLNFRNVFYNARSQAGGFSQRAFAVRTTFKCMLLLPGDLQSRWSAVSFMARLSSRFLPGFASRRFLINRYLAGRR